MPLHVADPDKGTVCGLPAPLSLTEIEPVYLPVSAIWKVTSMVHDAPGATLTQLFVCEKPVPEIVIRTISSVALPTLVSVTLPVAWPHSQMTELVHAIFKLRLDGVKSTTAPARATARDLAGALSATDRAPRAAR